MKYYKVTLDGADQDVYYHGKYKGTLIYRELITEGEVHKRYGKDIKLPATWVKVVEVKKGDTYWSFGARFEVSKLPQI